MNTTSCSTAKQAWLLWLLTNGLGLILCWLVVFIGMGGTGSTGLVLLIGSFATVGSLPVVWLAKLMFRKVLVINDKNVRASRFF